MEDGGRQTSGARPVEAFGGLRRLRPGAVNPQAVLAAERVSQAATCRTPVAQRGDLAAASDRTCAKRSACPSRPISDEESGLQPGAVFLPALRGSPLTSETSVVVIVASTGWPCCARLVAGQACGLPAFPVPRGRSGLRGQGRPAGPSPPGRCAAPWGPKGRPRTLSGRSKASGGAAASVPPGGQALLAHQRRHRVLADPPAGVAQRGGDPRRPVPALARSEQPPDLGFQPLPPRSPRRQPAVPPLVKPGLRHP
jgi:hypothetical protein